MMSTLFRSRWVYVVFPLAFAGITVPTLVVAPTLAGVVLLVVGVGFGTLLAFIVRSGVSDG
jgi:hypothetical protein